MLLMPKKTKKPIHEAHGETFGQRLCRLRKAQGMTQAELGAMVGVSTRALCSYERDQREPPAHLLPDLARQMGVSLDGLMGLEPLQSGREAPIARRWIRKFEQIEQLSDRKQRAIMQVLDMALTTGS